MRLLVLSASSEYIRSDVNSSLRQSGCKTWRRLQRLESVQICPIRSLQSEGINLVLRPTAIYFESSAHASICLTTWLKPRSCTLGLDQWESRSSALHLAYFFSQAHRDGLLQQKHYSCGRSVAQRTGGERQYEPSSQRRPSRKYKAE